MRLEVRRIARLTSTSCKFTDPWESDRLMKDRMPTCKRWPLLAAHAAGIISLFWVMAPGSIHAQSWEQTVAAAKKDGKVVVAMSPSAELRKAMEEAFEKKFGIDVELSPGQGATQVTKIVSEARAGVAYYDIMLSGTSSTADLVEHGVTQPVDPYLLLPEVREPKNWWGGHMYADKAKQFIYAPLAYVVVSLWYNKNFVKPGEIRTYDDLLHPKWKGKIGFQDPRVAGSGAGTWSFLWLIKGERFLEKLAQQDMLILTDRRQLGEALSTGKVHITIGGVYYTYAPFIKAGLSLDSVIPEEGSYGSSGSGNLTLIKNHPHPNAAKVFVNWFLGKEGQEMVTKTLEQATRRLDVETKWLRDGHGVVPAKDFLTMEQFLKNELSTQARIEQVRDPAERAAKKLLK
jgi:ABC-type Fe3+ transport system substrate-binding protein